MQYSEMNGMREYQKVPNYYGDMYRQIPPGRENWDGISGKQRKAMCLKTKFCFSDDNGYLRNGGYPRILPEGSNIEHQPPASGWYKIKA